MFKNYPSKIPNLFLIFLGSFLLLGMGGAFGQTEIPNNISKGIKVALEHYPELEGADIQIRLKKSIKKATMQARPTFGSILRSKKNRTYTIWVSEHFLIEGEGFLIKDVPDAIIIGWLGHELGHILDYKDLSNWQMLGFGFNYLFSDAHIIKTERRADLYAIGHGMEDYLVKTKTYILNRPNLSPDYRKRLEKYYLSPEEIIELAEEMEAFNGI